MPFHTHDGWHWDRDAEGNVVVTTPGGERHLMSPHEWASVVASMSAGGEVDGRWYPALEFHESAGAVAVIKR